VGFGGKRNSYNNDEKEKQLSTQTNSLPRCRSRISKAKKGGKQSPSSDL